ncbi:hypothetical protein GWK47_009833 [Chionoecetes opilio]|uniref:Uncharacterized protein n=1 Tax=Chionoecetes opilio TaxID=41210 RepID=A0A8J4XYX3_CHIOP|nr:hypothetical protein GWK47_009833 [Chionoecetes opilio]
MQAETHPVNNRGMNTKTKTLLWLFDKCPPIFSVPGNHGFTGPYPPTGEQVLLQYHGYHKQLQQASHLQSSALDAARLVTKDLQDWWVNTGITLKSWQAIEQMILTDIEEYKLRKSKRNRTTDTETKKREEFWQTRGRHFGLFNPSLRRDWQQNNSWRSKTRQIRKTGCTWKVYVGLLAPQLWAHAIRN